MLAAITRSETPPPLALAAWLAAQPAPDDGTFLAWTPECALSDGSGVRIGLLDSGLHFAHPLFSAARIHARDFTGSGGLGSTSRHGTVSAAMLVADGWYRGLLPRAELFFAKVLGGRDTPAAISRALAWLCREQVGVLAMPFGSRRPVRQVERAVRLALDCGAVVLAAAGHENAPPAFPAALRDVTAVGAEGLAAGRPDVRTWGVGVPAADPDPTTVSGTSVATVVAAALHALGAAHARRPAGPAR